MDLRHARTFVTVSELGTVSKAAQRLRIAQPALSRQIASLEQEFGLKLFDRTRGRLVLTGEGEQLLVDCRALLNQAHALGEKALLLRRGDSGNLKIAASPQFIEGVISPFWHQYSRRFPDVQLSLTEVLGWAQLGPMLDSGEVHLGQNLLSAVRADDERYANQPLETVGQLAAFHSKHSLGKARSVEIARLATHPLLLLDGNFVFRRTFDAACQLAGIKPNVKFESRTPHTLLALAEDKHGVAVIPSVARVRGYGLHVASVTHQGRSLREPLAIFWQKQRSLPRYTIGFCEMLAQYMRQSSR